MPRVSNKKKAERNKQLWNFANTSERGRWLTNSQKGYDFYLNDQLTAKEREDITKGGMPDFIINRITPIVEIMKYFVTANDPKWKAVGVEGSDADIAEVHSDIADYCWYISNGKSVYSQVVTDALTKGVGYFFINIDKDLDNGKGEVVFTSIRPDNLFVDPMSRDFLYRDAAFILYHNRFSRTQLMNMLPEFARKIKNAGGQAGATVYSQRDLDGSESIQPNEIISSVTPSGEEDEILDYYENYEKVSMGFWNVTIREMPTENEVENIKQLVAVQVKEFTSEMKVQLKEKLALIESELSEGKIIPDRAEIERENARKMFEQALADKKEELLSAAYEEITKISQVVISDEEYKIMVKNEELSKNIVSAVKFNESRIKVTVSVCDDTFLYEYYIDSKYYPIVPIPYTHTGTPYPMSAVLPMIGKQREINKAHQIMIHNANLASNIRWIYQEGAINETEWEDTSTVPGARLKYRSGFDAPVPVLPAPINNAFYTITEEGKTDIEYIAGIYSSMMGNAKEQPETYKGLLANDEYGTRRIKAWMNTVIEPCLEHLGRVFKDYAQKSYTIEKVFRIVQPQAGAEPVEQRINIPIYNDYGEVIGKWKDYASANFDVRIIAGATLPLNRWALIEEYFKWFQAGLIDDIAMLAETDIRNKERIVERNSLYSKLSNQNSQQEEKIKDLEGTVDTLKRQLIGAGIKHEVEVGSKEITNATLETKQQQKLIRGIMQTELNQFRDKMEQSFNLMKKEFELLKKEKKSS